MKRKFLMLLGAGLLIPLLFFGTAAARNGGSGSSETSNTTVATTQTDDSTTSADSTETATEKPDDKGLLARLAQLKTTRKTKLTATEQKHLQAVCKNAQGKATSTKSKVKGLATSRAEVYKNLTNRLDNLVTKLQARNADVTQLQSEITNLQALIQTFNTDLAAYKQDVTDLVAMDCNSDPTAFKAALDDARAARDKAIADSAAIKAYVNDTIKPTLKQIRKQLAETDGEATAETETDAPATTPAKPTATSTTQGSN